MKVYSLTRARDFYETRNIEGVYSTLELATKYMNIYLDKTTEGSADYRAYLLRDRKPFGPFVFIDEIEVIET
jgi:hypothetical protein